MPRQRIHNDERDYQFIDVDRVPGRPQPPTPHFFPPEDGIEVIDLDDDRRPIKPTTWHETTAH